MACCEGAQRAAMPRRGAGVKSVKVRVLKMCQSCQALRINGVLCHEIGCPDAWKDYSRVCKWCGSTFVPDDRDQICCDESCYCAWAGLPSPDDFDDFDELSNDDGFWDADEESGDPTDDLKVYVD